MDWFYSGMVDWHVKLAWASFALFLFRGLVWQIDQPWSERIAKDGRLLVLAFAMNTLLVVSGLSLWVSLHYSLFRSPWLMIKLIALVGYFVSGHWSMGKARFHQLGYVIALACMGIVMVVSITRQGF
ncbi:SirB2 family protein [Burkholderiaceae bacterium UC74_6]